MSETSTRQFDVAACEREPIHIPGSIQPFGVLLAFDAATLRLRHASENIRDVLEGGGTELFGLTVTDLLGAAAESALRGAVAEDGLFDLRPIHVSFASAHARRWRAMAHCLAGKVIVELEAADEGTLSSADLLAAVRAAAGQLSAASSISEFCATAVRKVRSMTGYDRVMVYRFDAEFNGEVIAEDRLQSLEPYLGLHYPASDIPAQARALFLVNRMRVIPDAAAKPIPVMQCDGEKKSPLDLSRSLLRSASPIHLEYLHNMGVRASMTASLIVGGKLWGMIACHHSTPKRLGPAEREACDLLAQIASAHLAFLAEVEDREYLAQLTEALGRMGARLGATSPPIGALAKNEADLLALVGAEGAVVWRSGRGLPIGRTPPDESLPDLIGWIKGRAASVISTDRLSYLYPPAKVFADVASGLLALEVSRDASEYVVWFRPEILQSVNWGGDPNGKTGLDGRLSPRRSFAVWKETVRYRSLPWRPAEVENARRVKDLLLTAASLAALRLEALLPICAWCKKVRDEPGYWRGVEEFIHDLVDVRFTHGVCPECLEKQLAEFSRQKASPARSR